MASKKSECVVRLSAPVVSVGPAFRECLALAVMATLALPSTPASAQVVCTTTPTEITCTNSGTNNTGILTQQFGDGNAASTNSGTNSGGITTQAFGNGSATSTNSGTNSGGITTQAFGNGDATTTNSGSNSGGIFIQAFGNGNALATNSGSNSGGIFVQAFGDGNATTTNSGINSGSISTLAFGVGNATTTNSATNSGGITTQTFDTGNATTTNSGTNNGSIITQTFAIGNATTINSGTNNGDINTQTFGIGDATTVNSGTNSGDIITQTFGVGSNAAMINTGTNNGAISTHAIGGGSNAAMINSGTVNGRVELFTTSGTSSLINSGTIRNSSGVAIQFAGGPDTLTLLPGSFIIGAINLVGVDDTVNVRVGNQNLTFNTLAGATVTGTVPFVIAGNRIASIDPTPFGLADKNLMDFTRAVSSILGSIGDTTSTSSGQAASNAFAAETGSNRVGDAFASIPALGYAGSDSMAFKNPTMVYADGRSVWARGFVGERFQRSNGASLGARNLFEGGAIGVDLLALPDLRIGIFAGGGHGQLSVDSNAGSTRTDTVFGGLYGRYAFASFGAPSYLDFVLQGGGSNNGVIRGNINNNLLAGGLETATASYSGTYVSPELTYGVKLPLWANYVLTPSIRLRYVAGTFGGYTESGSTANLTVANRTIQDFEQRGELKLTRVTAFTARDVLLTSVNVGVLGIERLGDTTINTVLLGQGLPLVTPGKNNVVGLFGGLGMEWRTRSGVSFFGAAEYTAMSDQATTIVGRGGVKVAF